MANNKKRDSPKLRIKEPLQNKSIKRVEDDYPLFCFKHLSDASIKGCRDHEFFCKFLLRLNKLSELGWEEIRKSQKHSFGMEPVPICKIKKDLPPFITPDVEKIHVFRASGDNRSLIGLQREKVFHVLFIESKFGDIYDHD